MSTNNSGANTNNIPLLLNNIEARLGELGPSSGFVRNPMTTTLLGGNFDITNIGQSQSETVVCNDLEVALGASPGQTLFIHNQSNLLNYGADDQGNNTIGNSNVSTLTTFPGKVTFNIPPTLTLAPVALANPQTEYNVLVDTSLPQVFVVKDSVSNNSIGMNGTNIVLWNPTKTANNTLTNQSLVINNTSGIGLSADTAGVLYFRPVGTTTSTISSSIGADGYLSSITDISANVLNRVTLSTQGSSVFTEKTVGSIQTQTQMDNTGLNSVSTTVGLGPPTLDGAVAISNGNGRTSEPRVIIQKIDTLGVTTTKTSTSLNDVFTTSANTSTTTINITGLSTSSGATENSVQIDNGRGSLSVNTYPVVQLSSKFGVLDNIPDVARLDNRQLYFSHTSIPAPKNALYGIDQMYITDLVNSNTINSTSIQIDNGTNVSNLTGALVSFSSGIYDTSMDNSGFGSFIAGTVGNDAVLSCGSTSSPPSLGLSSQLPSALGLGELDNRSLKFTLAGDITTMDLTGLNSNASLTLASGSSNSINLNSAGDITLSPSTSSAFNTVIMNNLPTSSSGLSAGCLWNNGGVLNIV